MLTWIPPAAVAASMRHVEAGAKRAGRSLSDIDVTVYVRTCVTDEPAPAREALARDITGYAIVSVYARFFAECGFAEEVLAVNSAWKAGDRAGAVKGISERVLDGLGAVGSADECRAHMDAVARTGRRRGSCPLRRRDPGARIHAADIPRVSLTRAHLGRMLKTRLLARTIHEPHPVGRAGPRRGPGMGRLSPSRVARQRHSGPRVGTAPRVTSTESAVVRDPSPGLPRSPLAACVLAA